MDYTDVLKLYDILVKHDMTYTNVYLSFIFMIEGTAIISELSLQNVTTVAVFMEFEQVWEKRSIN